MTATNHALGGALVALVLKEPVLALPLAFLSHFLLDSLPHFGMHTWEERRQNPAILKAYFVIEPLTLVLLITFFVVMQAPTLVYICSIVAILPDAVWWYRFIVPEKWGTRSAPPMNRFNQWHSDIQKLESIRPGMYLETLAAVCLSVGAYL